LIFPFYKLKWHHRTKQLQLLLPLVKAVMTMAEIRSTLDPGRLKEQYDELLDQASYAQKHGKYKDYAEITKEADAIWQQIEQLDIERGHS
jgi:hypothetical protein